MFEIKIVDCLDQWQESQVQEQAGGCQVDILAGILLYKDLFLTFEIMCMFICLARYAKRGCQISGAGIAGDYEPPAWMLGTKLKSSTRMVHALKCLASLREYCYSRDSEPFVQSFENSSCGGQNKNCPHRFMFGYSVPRWWNCLIRIRRCGQMLAGSSTATPLCRGYPSIT